MAINVSITLNDPARTFYGFGPYTITNSGPTTVDLSLFSNAELGNLVSSVNGGELVVTGKTASQFEAFVGGVTASLSSLVATASGVLTTALTGFVSGAGTVAAADTILSAFNKINGNVALRAPLASPTFTGTVTTPMPTVTGATVTTSAPSAGAAGALPATPSQYVTWSINGTSYKVAVY